jgi:hypothetical protein
MGSYENRPAEVENKGLEVVLDGTPVNTPEFRLERYGQCFISAEQAGAFGRD